MPDSMDFENGHEMTRFILYAATRSVFKASAENPIYIQDAHFLTHGSMNRIGFGLRYWIFELLKWHIDECDPQSFKHVLLKPCARRGSSTLEDLRQGLGTHTV